MGDGQQSCGGWGVYDEVMFEHGFARIRRMGFAGCRKIPWESVGSVFKRNN